ncbi:DUF1993 domain-containing protein [Dyella caseinilytica]|uniref:DUF1993 domain-containing protein n=1 Tax=Dyella caseinilytica TaxID=1849581 RepID=A0ABX7GVK8_9GAMM|nr:DUF1993 domain-containing protein [Dyella caseinilytica]QRN54103.1 DUF1993 domain-containing protein [Dyella caseinilytica]GFZ91576.1 hypothetical protein GCM10011408_08680 [Dyella caseinilytica]
MSMSMYQVAIPVFVRALQNLHHVLKLGEAHAKAKNVEDSVVLHTRLIPDMLPLVKQVQIATDMAKNGTARLAGVDPLKFEDNETSFDELYNRIERAIDYIKSFKPEQIDGSETRTVTIKTRNGDQSFEGHAYLLHFVIPNLFFHCTTAYNILRESGAHIGKQDFIGKS